MKEVITPRELHGKRLLGYSLGFIGILLADIFRGVFIFQFYVYTVNLNSILVTIGMAMRLVIAAISSIVFGVLADNKKPGKLGKRRPFMIYLLPVWVLTSILVWLPPWYCPKTNSMYLPTALYLWVILIVNAVSGMSILSVHASMLPEQSQTHKNREKVASMSTILAIIVSILALFLPLVVQSLLKDPENAKWWQPSGKVILFYIPLIGVAFAIFGLISVIITFLSVDEKFHIIRPDLEMKKRSIIETFHHMVIPAKDKKFRKFIENLRNKEIIEKKPLCRIILFGSYYPEEMKEFLIKIRNDLRDEGYINTWLVENYPTYEDLGIREKSISCLEFSNINFFIITFEGEKGGLTVELEHIISNAKRLSFQTVVFYEIKNENEISSLSELNKEGLISANIRMHEFKIENYEDLSQLIKGEAWNLHYHYVLYEKQY